MQIVARVYTTYKTPASRDLYTRQKKFSNDDNEFDDLIAMADGKRGHSNPVES